LKLRDSVVSLWLAYGTENENVPDQIAKELEYRKDLKVTIAVLNPKAKFLQEVDDYLALPLGSTERRIKDSLKKLIEAKRTLSNQNQDRFIIKVYNVLPTVSLIGLDINEKEASIQADFKLYKASRQNSFGIEFKGKDFQLFSLMKSTMESMLKDSEVFDEKTHF
jgi:hypothetical protein